MKGEYEEIGGLTDHSRLRLETLVRIRWVAVVGQTLAVLIVWLYLDFDFSAVTCFVLIASSAMLNLSLGFRYPANHRLSPRAAVALLTFDIIQLVVLLFMTGGLQNPFSFLMLVPVIISATTLQINSTMFLGIIVVVSATALAFFHLPLPWLPGRQLELPSTYITGMWVAIVSSLSFVTIYVFRVADESRTLAEALTATELVLQREQYLSNLDGLAAAAAHELGTPLGTITLVSKEMTRELQPDSPFYEDVKLLRSQAERCREILRTLSSLSTQGDAHIAQIRFSGILEDVSAPHREFGIAIDIQLENSGGEPVCMRNSGILYGLGNLVENAVDHAEERVVLRAFWDEKNVSVEIHDDGKGFDDEVISRIGEPYVTKRIGRRKGGGLGLGLFIAKTLLERSGAKLSFTNKPRNGLSGACVKVVWPRELIEVHRQ